MEKLKKLKNYVSIEILTFQTLKSVPRLPLMISQRVEEKLLGAHEDGSHVTWEEEEELSNPSYRYLRDRLSQISLLLTRLACSSVALADIAKIPCTSHDNEKIGAASAWVAKRPTLPDELWGHVWQSLTLYGRVQVSHVCRAWRAAALVNPSLWADLRLHLTRHPHDCECDTCGNTEERPPSLELGLHRLSVLFDRSMHAPLTFSLDVALARDGDVVLADRMRDMLGAHSARLLCVTADCTNGDGAIALVSSLANVPRLRDLSLAYKRSGRRDRRFALSPSHFALMPKLTRLDVLYSLTWDQRTSSFPALTRLSISFSAVDHILHALRSCPRLCDLTARLTALTDFGSAIMWDEIRTRCSSLSHLLILQPPKTFPVESLVSLAQAEAASITVDYTQNMHFPIHYDERAAHANTMLIMRHLLGPIRMAFHTTPSTMTVEGRDAQRVRTLRWQGACATMASMHALREQLATHALDWLDVSWTAHHLVLGTLPTLPTLRHLTVTLPENFNAPFPSPTYLPINIEAPRLCASMPALSTVTLRSAAEVSLAAAAAVDFVRDVTAGRCIHAFELHNVRITGDSHRLDALVDNVIYSSER